jgi:hypothetical protein
MEIVAYMAYADVLSLVPRTFGFVPFVKLRQSLPPSQIAAISPCVDQFLRFIAKFRAVRRQRGRC